MASAKFSVNAKENTANAKSTGGAKPTEPAEDRTVFEELFGVWEKRTSEYCERWLRNPTVLGAMGGLMTAGYKNKILLDKTLTAVWKNLNLPTKRDQERTLHLLNELHTRLHEMEEKLRQEKSQR